MEAKSHVEFKGNWIFLWVMSQG